MTATCVNCRISDIECFSGSIQRCAWATVMDCLIWAQVNEKLSCLVFSSLPVCGCNHPEVLFER